MNEGPAYLSLPKAALLMGVSYPVLHRMVCEGTIPDRFLLKSGSRRPRVYLHRSFIEQGVGAQP